MIIGIFTYGGEFCSQRFKKCFSRPLITAKTVFLLFVVDSSLLFRPEHSVGIGLAASLYLANTIHQSQNTVCCLSVKIFMPSLEYKPVFFVPGELMYFFWFHYLPKLLSKLLVAVWSLRKSVLKSI